MNGWQRLWVLLSGIMALITIAAAFSLIIRQDEYRNDHEQLMDNYQTKLKEIQYPTNEPAQDYYYNEQTSHLRTVDEVKSAMRHANDDYKEKVDNLPWLQAKLASLWLIGWATICSIVYVFGWLVAWVIRGFRPKRV